MSHPPPLQNPAIQVRSHPVCGRFFNLIRRQRLIVDTYIVNQSFKDRRNVWILCVIGYIRADADRIASPWRFRGNPFAAATSFRPGTASGSLRQMFPQSGATVRPSYQVWEWRPIPWYKHRRLRSTLCCRYKIQDNPPPDLLSPD